jgi:lipopolysaccharide export system permease protein
LVFEILAYLVPHYMGMALPISLFLGVLIGFSRLGRDGELDAMHAASIGLRRLARPAHVTACVLMIVATVIIGYLQPYGRYAYQSLVFAISNASFHAFLRAGVFAQADGVSFLIEEIKPDGISFGKVFIHEQTEDGASVSLTARGGRLGYDESETIPMLRLADGIRLEVKASEAGDASNAEPTLPSISALRFDELRMDLGRDTAQLFRPRGKDEREFTLWELWQRRFDPPPDVLPFLAIPLALGRRRSERSFGIAMGLVVLVVYNQVLDLGENVTETGAIGPWLGLWTPFFAFAFGSLFLFHRATTQVPGTRVFALQDRAKNVIGSWLPPWASARKDNP